MPIGIVKNKKSLCRKQSTQRRKNSCYHSVSFCTYVKNLMGRNLTSRSILRSNPLQPTHHSFFYDFGVLLPKCILYRTKHRLTPTDDSLKIPLIYTSFRSLHFLFNLMTHFSTVFLICQEFRKRNYIICSYFPLIHTCLFF